MSILQARLWGYNVVTDNDKNQCSNGSMELINKTHNLVNMIVNEKYDGLYETQVSEVEDKVIITKGMETLKAHAGLGHFSKNVLQLSMSHIKVVKQSEIGQLNYDCKSCIMGISTQKPRKSRESDIVAPQPVATVHTDVVRPIECLSMRKAKYFVTSINEFRDSRW